MKHFLIVASLGLSLVACGRGGSSGDDDGGDDDDAPPPDAGGLRVQDVQSEDMPEGTVVELKGVVVTAIDAFGGRTGDMFVEDPAGGEFSGIKVFGAPLDQIAQLEVGSIITISNAAKSEFALTSDTSGRKVTELVGAGDGDMTITETTPANMNNNPLPIETVDARAIAELATEAERDAEWEKWEGVLIKVVNARQLSDIGTFGANADQKEFDATGGIAVQTVLSDFPTSALPNTCYLSITGIGDYFFNYLLLHRDPGDLVTGGTGCQESAATSITDIQAGRATGPVDLKDVFVTAISFNKKNLWLSTSLDAKQNEGIFVFRGNGANVAVLPADVVVGAKVDITANAVEGNNDQVGDTITQLTGPTITVKAAPVDAPTPIADPTVADLNVAATGEPFESVLVSFKKVKVNSVGTTATFFVGELQLGDTKFMSDDDILRLLDADVGKCFDFVGLWTYSIFENKYGFLPITKAEVTCP